MVEVETGLGAAAGTGGSPLLLLIEEWRRLLARSIATRNPDLTSQGVNLSVQCVIDRLLFLWICEGRELEPDGCTAALGEMESPDIALFELFHRAAGRYGGIFPGEGRHDPLRGVTIDGRSVLEVVRLLLTPNLPHPGHITPEEVGTVLEQFLGSKIRIIDGQASIGLRYDVERAGGIQVVPWLAIEHVVVATLAPLVPEDNDGSSARIMVLDPACGAGLYLLAAFRHLSLRMPEVAAVNCLYGLDVDPAAAEAARLVLSLALLDTGLGGSMLPLPVLDHIRSGNSLIGPDIYDDVRTKSYDHERRDRINAFSWEAGFYDALQKGGFDAVIGAPPPIRPSPGRVEREYLERHYAVYHGGGALPPYFIERGFSLLRAGGRLGYAIAGDWLRSKYGQSLRRWLQSYQIEEIIACIPARIGDGRAPAPMPLSLLVAERSLPAHPFTAARLSCSGEVDIPRMLAIHGHPIDQSKLGEGGWTLEDRRAHVLVSRIAASDRTLAEHLMSRIRRGAPVPPGCIIGSSLQKRLLAADPRLDEVVRPLLSVSTIVRYGWGEASAEYVLQIPVDERIDENLSRIAEAAERVGLGPLPAGWRCGDEPDGPRILMAARAPRPAATLDAEGTAPIDDTVIVVPSGSLYLLGLLNSRLFAFLIGEFSPIDRPIAIRTLERLPVVTLDPDVPREAALYDRFVGLVEERVSLGGAGDECTAPVAAEIERQIDAIVYDIYGLSAGERDLVDRSVGSLK